MNCKICFDEFNLHERTPITVMLCGHTFCLDCLSEMKQQKYECAYCKAEIVSEKPNYVILELLEAKQETNQAKVNKTETKETEVNEKRVANIIANSTKYSNEADELFGNSKFAEAVKLYDKSILLQPDNVTAFYKKGCCLMKLKKEESALVCFNEVIRVDANHIAAYNQRGFCYYEINEDKKAEDSFNKALELNVNPTTAELLCEKGLSYEGLEEFEQAFEYYEKAINLDPNYYLAYFYKGYLCSHIEEFEKSNECYDQVLKLNPNYAIAHSNKGYNFVNLKKYQESIECFDEALKINANLDLFKNNKKFAEDSIEQTSN